MKVGDKVRLIHGKEEGRIVKIIDPRQVEVEIEDGFRIPTLVAELVVVASEETTYVNKGDFDSIDVENPYRWNGLFLAFTQFNDQTYEMHLINDTSYTASFVIGEEKDEKYKGVFSGSVKKEAAVKLLDVNIRDFDQWPEFLVQLLFFSYGESIFRQPLVKKIKFRTATFFKSKKLAPVLNKEAYLFRLDQDAVKIDVKRLEENLQEGNKSSSIVSVPKPSREVDLHIEKLTPEYAGMSNTAMLNLQMTEFQKNLDNAFATGMEEIVFIHGVGNGVLKKEIHKALSGNKSIKFFQEAQKEKFGYGATLVRLR